MGICLHDIVSFKETNNKPFTFDAKNSSLHKNISRIPFMINTCSQKVVHLDWLKRGCNFCIRNESFQCIFNCLPIKHVYIAQAKLQFLFIPPHQKLLMNMRLLK